ncbi:MAG: TonB family protein [Methylovirgula sp.]|uniref:TonB family protein n=1 Tax=Methylovirgula sp. TaxID=1978224 RepID=UPI00307648E8
MSVAHDHAHQIQPPQEPFWRRYRLQFAVGAIFLLLAAGLARLIFNGDNNPPPKQVRDLTFVKIMPPPPPPPPPPPQQLPQPKMIEQPKMVTPEIKQPDKPDDKPLDKPKADKDDAPPPGPLALDAKAEGPGDAFGLAGNPGGHGFLGGGGGGGGSRWGWYASLVQNAIETALHANPAIRNAVMKVRVRIWADQSGRIERVQLASSTGDKDVDAALQDALSGVALGQAPPTDMPMPIVAQITGRRPN